MKTKEEVLKGVFEKYNILTQLVLAKDVVFEAMGEYANQFKVEKGEVLVQEGVERKIVSY